MLQRAPQPDLKTLPLIDCGADFPLATLHAYGANAHALLDVATAGIPAMALKQLDAVSRRWLWKWSNDHLDEIDRVAAFLNRPGCYFFSVNYEWGCTNRVAPSPDHKSARLVRVLDWGTPGLGKNVVAARVNAKAGPFVTLTWPGYTGVLTAMAPGRFSAALNQAPMRKALGFYYLDWAANRRRVWSMPHPTPAHLLRSVMEEAQTYAEARRRLMVSPISTPAIFSLAGTRPAETCIIERKETEARVFDGANVASNHWQTPGWRGHPRGCDSAGRACRMHAVSTEMDPAFSWLEPPILNAHTRIVMIADAARGELVAQGFEDMAPATAPLQIAA
jgi:hypothetical protein